MHDVIGKFILKGVAFPVCISVNEFVCHCSPLETEEGVSDWKLLLSIAIPIYAPVIEVVVNMIQQNM